MSFSSEEIKMSFITLSKLHGHGFDYQLMLHNTSQSPLDTRCLYSVHVKQAVAYLGFHFGGGVQNFSGKVGGI